MNTGSCPVCSKSINLEEIEQHVNNCLFLNSRHENSSKKRKDDNFSTRQSKVIKSFLSCASEGTKKEGKYYSEIQEKAQYSFETPLSEALRPRSLNNFVGQEQILGVNAVLRKLLDHADVPPSLILWGPPGCGKTTLANVIREVLMERSKNKTGPSVRFVKLYATMVGVAEVKEVLSIAKNERTMFQRRTVLFMDEIHRFNKSQQDTFLPHVENGTITLIGATTENPSFSLNNALLSRCQVVTLDKLSTQNIIDILYRAVHFASGSIISPAHTCSTNEVESKWSIDAETIQWLAEISDGDARIALNCLQMAIQSVIKCDSDTLVPQITLNDIKDSIKKSHILYDKKGDEHYNQISALHKSIRASDDNAALYWLTRMLEGGEDPIYIARRLVRAASEDIGIAEPNALTLAVSTLQGCQLIGMPECDVLLAQLVVYLARCPKSTEIYSALKKAKTCIAEHKGALPSVPLHLRNAPTKLMSDLGYGQEYNKLHKSESGLEYMPQGLEHVTFFDQ